MIYRQNDESLNGIVYGKARKSFAQAGCGLAAVYNALELIGDKKDIISVRDNAERLRLPWMRGIFGTKPLAVGRLLSHYKVTYQRCFSLKKLKAALKSRRTVIICSWNDRFTTGIHFYCVYYDKIHNCLMSLNYVYANSPVKFDISKLRPSRFITAYILY